MKKLIECFFLTGLGLLSLNTVVMASQIPFNGSDGPRERFIQSVVNIVHFLYAEVTNGTGIGNKSDKSP